MSKAMVLGGNGQVGSAAARTLLASGWDVTCSGRAEARFPADLREAGVRFCRSDRYDARDLRNLLYEGADVMVDCVAYTSTPMAATDRTAVPLRVGAASMALSKDGHLGRRRTTRHPSPRLATGGVFVNTPIRILLVDDHRLFTEGLTELLSFHDDLSANRCVSGCET